MEMHWRKTDEWDGGVALDLENHLGGKLAESDSHVISVFTEMKFHPHKRPFIFPWLVFNLTHSQ